MQRFWCGPYFGGARLSALFANFVLATFFILSATAFAFADDDSAVQEGVDDQQTSAPLDAPSSFVIKVGINGVYKNGFQTRVVVEWGSSYEAADAVELETIDPDGAQFVMRSSLSEQDKQAKRSELSFVFPKANGYLTARLLTTDNVLVEKKLLPSDKRGADDGSVFTEPFAPTRPIYLVVGEENQGFAEAFAELRLKEDRRPLILKVDSAEELPTDLRSYEAVERLFLTTSDPAYYANVDVASPQMRELKRWVERGGNVVILAGDRSIPLLSPGGPLSELSPGATVAEKTREFRAVNAFVTDLQNVKNLAMTGSRSNPYLRTPVISDLKEGAIVEMSETRTPLLVARPLGLGSVIYFAADLASAPISNWSGRGRLALKILGVDPDKKTGSVAPSSSFVKRGYVDLSGQIRSALDSFDGVRPVQFSFVAALMFVYLLVIAPLDWFFVKKVVKKPVITWITFSASILLFAVAAVWVYAKRTPPEAILGQTDVIDVDMTSGIVRDTTWTGFYSPISARYDVRMETQSLSAKDDASLCLDDSETLTTFAPLTLSGGGLGGAEQKTYSQRLWSAPYRLERAEKEATVAGTPMTARSSKSFVGRWTSRLRETPRIPELVDDGMSLVGAVFNPLDVPIYSAYIIYNGGAYYLGTLAPGVTPIERGATRVEAMRALNEHKSSAPTTAQGAWDGSSYNVASTRAPYILRAASFYDFGGGEANWGIAKRLQADVDLSALLRCGRAVIYGTIVDDECEEYRPNEELGRKAADAIELENLNKKIAAEKGETLENAREAAIELYGICGSSDDFMPTKTTWIANGASERKAAVKRESVIRLVTPLSYAASKGKE